MFLILRSERKKAAVGRRYERVASICSWKDAHVYIHREMQLFLVGFIIIEIAEIFTVGEFPLSSKVRIVCATIPNTTGSGN